jgi:hypothetical protein
MDRELIMEILRVLVATAVFVITRYVIPAVREWTRGTQLEQVAKWCYQAVLAIEQTYGHVQGRDRKRIATEFLKKMLIRKNISLSDEELDMLIEAAVRQMNLSDLSRLKEPEAE